MNFVTNIKSINSINNIIKNIKNGEIDSKYIDSVYQGLEEGSFNTCSLFNKLNGKLEKMSEQIKENSQEIKKLKIENDNIKRKVKELKINNDIFINKVEEEKLKNWINEQGDEPILHQPLAENQLTKNYILKYVIDKSNKIKKI